MLRPQHGTSRWLLLFCACIALAATAAIPRGLLRATVLTQMDPVAEIGAGTDGDAYDSVEPDAELPGVRVVISREERDVDDIDELHAPVPDAARAAVGAGLAAAPPVEPPDPCSVSDSTCDSRAPPASV